MKLKLTKLILLLVPLLVIGVETGYSAAQSVIVPIDYPDLQTAINNVLPGTSIYVDTDLTINSPITIIGKNGLSIVFRHGSKLIADSGFVGQEIVLVEGSSNIILSSFTMSFEGSSALPVLDFLRIKSSNNVEVKNLTLAVNTNVHPTILRFIRIDEGSLNITVTNVTGVDMSLTSLGVVGVFANIQFMSNGYITINNLLFEDIALASPSSFEGVRIELMQVNSLNIKVSNMAVNRVYSTWVQGINSTYFRQVGDIETSYANITLTNIVGSGGGISFRGLVLNRFTAPIIHDSIVTIQNIVISSWMEPNTPGPYMFDGVIIEAPYFNNLTIKVDGVVINDVNSPDIFGLYTISADGIHINVGYILLEAFGLPTYDIKIDIDRVSISRLYSWQTIGILSEFNGFFTSRVRYTINNVNITNIGIYDFGSIGIGMALTANSLYDYRVWVENFFFNDREGIGANIWLLRADDLHPIDTPKDLNELRQSEDLYFAYSMLWRIIMFSSWPNFITLFETVVDELNSFIGGLMRVRNVWTLETFVYSSITMLPIQGIYVEYLYPTPGQYSFGYTDPAGRYSFIMDYYMTNPPIVQVGLIQVAVSSGYYSSSVMLPNYISVAEGLPLPESYYTLPAWFGEVVFMIPLVSLSAMGFSHDMGTTYLFITGTIGWFAGYYSYTPDELWNGDLVTPRINNTWVKSPFRNYQLRGLRVSWTGSVIQVLGEIFYDGYWQPVTIYIDPERRIVWSPGPVDFRGWF